MVGPNQRPMEPSSGGETAVRPTPDSVAVEGRRVGSVPVGRVLRALGRPRFAWASGDGAILAGGAAATVEADGSGRFAEVREGARAVFDSVTPPSSVPAGARPRIVGGFAFHEDHDSTAATTWRGYPGAQFVLPEVQLVTTAEGSWLTVASSGADVEETAEERLDRWTSRLDALPDRAPTEPPAVRRAGPTPDREAWRRQVRTALADIDEGTLRKVVLAGSLSVDLAGDLDVPDVLARLGETYPDCVRFLVEPQTGDPFFGATPERLVSLRGGSIRTTVLAGSAGRGDTEAEDDWLAEDLRGSAKDAREHEVVVEAIRDQLAPLASTVTTGERGIRKLATVQHLETPVRATLDGNAHVVDLVEALHPTPAVGGVPQEAALRTIRAREGFDRGWYAAPVGWMDAAGDGAFSVAIRSALAHGSAATLFAGNGIVADSHPDREWSELQLKYRSILDELA